MTRTHIICALRLAKERLEHEPAESIRPHVERLEAALAVPGEPAADVERVQ